MWLTVTLFLFYKEEIAFLFYSIQSFFGWALTMNTYKYYLNVWTVSDNLGEKFRTKLNLDWPQSCVCKLFLNFYDFLTILLNTFIEGQEYENMKAEILKGKRKLTKNVLSLSSIQIGSRKPLQGKQVLNPQKDVSGTHSFKLWVW